MEQRAYKYILFAVEDGGSIEHGEVGGRGAAELGADGAGRAQEAGRLDHFRSLTGAQP